MQKNHETAMLTKNDIKDLVGINNNIYALMKYTFITAIIFFFVSAGFNLYLSINYASLHGLNFSNTMNLWNEGASLERVYSGLEHQSLIKLNTAIIRFGAAIVFVILLIHSITIRKRNKRILSVLVKCGEIKKEDINA